MDTPGWRRYWRDVEQIAESAKKLPAWMKGQDMKKSKRVVADRIGVFDFNFYARGEYIDDLLVALKDRLDILCFGFDNPRFDTCCNEDGSIDILGDRPMTAEEKQAEAAMKKIDQKNRQRDRAGKEKREKAQLKKLIAKYGADSL